ncbi:MAG: adenine nucleotide alpha hydrolase [Rikenellaceae bacterium]|nr:adenine nucleotide alpha hydrolase [Rikenellaceae bacterium]
MGRQEKIKAVFNWSGGKDSALALYKTLVSGEYEVVSLLTTVDRDSRRSAMHEIPEEILRDQAGSIGLPICIAGVDPEGDRDIYEAVMRDAVEYFKESGVTHFIFGDIFLPDVRSYREKQLAPYGIEVVEPLWGSSSEDVMTEFLISGLQTVIVAVAGNILGKEFIGRKIDRAFLKGLPSGCDPCGENGEYHTLCYDGPLFRYPVSFHLDEPQHVRNQVRAGDGSVTITDIYTSAARSVQSLI